MDFGTHLKGKVFIVTAAGEAGRAKAACYAARGASVALVVHGQAGCQALAHHPRIRVIADAEVGSATGWLNVVRTALDVFGRIDGVFDDGSIHDPSREDDGQLDDCPLDAIVLV